MTGGRRLPRPSLADAMLTTLVVTWGLNIVITRYLLINGFEPLVYSALRYVSSSALLVAYVRVRQGPLTSSRGGSAWLLVAAAVLFAINQIAFVLALTWTDATVVAFMFGAAPVVTGLITWAVGTERMTWRFALAAVVSLAGVGLLALSAGADGTTGVRGVAAAVVMLLTWCSYTVLTAWMMRTRSASQITALAFFGSGVIISLAAIPQFGQQDWDLPVRLWLLLAFTVGSLIVTNLLYLTSMRRVGASHTALFANLQPFIAVLLAVLLLSETLTLLDLLGGLAIAAGIAIVWSVRAGHPPAVAPDAPVRAGPAGPP